MVASGCSRQQNCYSERFDGRRRHELVITSLISMVADRKGRRNRQIDSPVRACAIGAGGELVGDSERRPLVTGMVTESATRHIPDHHHLTADNSLTCIDAAEATRIGSTRHACFGVQVPPRTPVSRAPSRADERHLDRALEIRP